MSLQRIIVYGGRGALGAKCVSHFKTKNCVSFIIPRSLLHSNKVFHSGLDQ